jgi:glutamate racemase
MVVACNTASVRLEESPEVRERADRGGVRLHSMVDLFDSLLQKEAAQLRGKRVCVMGTRYTVDRPVYARRLRDAGVSDVIPLCATRTERAIAHFACRSAEGRALIREEIEDVLAGADAVLLACTCFPLVGDLIDAIKPGIHQLDPGLEVREVLPTPGRGRPNQLTLACTGTAVTADALRAEAPALFPGWDEITVVNLPD